MTIVDNSATTAISGTSSPTFTVSPPDHRAWSDDAWSHRTEVSKELERALHEALDAVETLFGPQVAASLRETATAPLSRLYTAFDMMETAYNTALREATARIAQVDDDASGLEQQLADAKRAVDELRVRALHEAVGLARSIQHYRSHGRTVPRALLSAHRTMVALAR